MNALKNITLTIYLYITTLTNEVVSIRKKLVQSVHIHKHTSDYKFTSHTLTNF